jgi:hypothetical protein
MPDTYFAPANKISFDTTSDLGVQHYIAVLTGTNFPNNKILKNQVTILRLVRANGGSSFINFPIDSTLHKNQSLVRVLTEYWYDANYGFGQPNEVLGHSFVYAKCDSPTIGKINNYNGICNVLTGRIKDPKNNFLHGIMLHNDPDLLRGFLDPSIGVSLSSTHTDSAGKFIIHQIASFPSTITFYDSINISKVSQKKLGPFYGEPDSTIDIGDFVLDDYIPTGVVKKNIEVIKNISPSLNVLGVFSGNNKKGAKIVIVNNTNASSPIIISILTVKGQKIRDISAVISGAGTNTISWDGKNALGKKVPAGTYVVNLFSNNKQVKKSYAVIQ